MELTNQERGYLRELAEKYSVDLMTMQEMFMAMYSNMRL